MDIVVKPITVKPIAVQPVTVAPVKVVTVQPVNIPIQQPIRPSVVQPTQQVKPSAIFKPAVSAELTDEWLNHSLLLDKPRDYIKMVKSLYEQTEKSVLGISRFGQGVQKAFETITEKLFEHQKKNPTFEMTDSAKRIMDLISSVDLDNVVKQNTGWFKRKQTLADYLTVFNATESSIDSESRKLKNLLTGVEQYYKTMDKLISENTKNTSELELHSVVGKIIAERHPELNDSVMSKISEFDRVVVTLNMSITQIAGMQSNILATCDKFKNVCYSLIPMWKTQHMALFESWRAKNTSRETNIVDVIKNTSHDQLSELYTKITTNLAS